MAGVGRPKNPPAPKKMLKEVLPVGDIFKEEELVMYHDLVDVYLADFDIDDLTSSDMDDIMDLAKNRVLEFRLLKSTKDNADKQLDIANAVEKLAKKNEKIKEALSSRRKDRINPNELKGFSIVDLAVAFDTDAKRAQLDRINTLRDEEAAMLDKRKEFVGNRYDTYEDANKDNNDG